MEHRLGLAVVSYHSLPDLTAFCESLVEVAPQIPVFLDIISVEATEQERRATQRMAWDVRSVVELAGTENHSDNVGYAKACNAAAVDLDPHVDTFAFFNADTQLRRGALEHCVETLWSDDSYGVLGPRQVDENRRITHAGIFGTLDKPAHRGWMQETKAFQDIRDDCVTVSGSAYFVKKPVWDQLAKCPIYRLIDPRSLGAFLTTRLYYEETFCSYHAISHGHKVVYDGGTTIIHKWHKAVDASGIERTGVFQESKKRFVEACEMHGIPHD